MKVIAISSFDFTKASAGQARQRLILMNLANSGIEVTLVNPAINRPADLEVSTHYLPKFVGQTLRRFFVAPWIFFKILDSTSRGNILIVFDRSPLTVVPTIAAAKFCRLAIVQELTEHPNDGTSTTRKSQFLAGLFGKILPNFDGFIVISSALRSFVLDRVHNAKIFLVPAIGCNSNFDSATPIPSYESVDALRTHPFSFLYAGSLSETKDGVLSLIAAFAQAFQKEGSARLDLLGYGSLAQKAAVQAAIVDLGVSQSVTLHDPVPQAELPARLAAADALVLCRPLSRQATYGFPTKLAEYLATGRPVVVTLTSDIGHYLRNDVSGFLVPPNDIEAFASAMHRAASDPAEAAQIGAAGHAVFLAEFEASRAVAKLSEWLRSEFSRPGGVA